MIESKRLILRPFLESDAEDVLEYLKKPAVLFASMKSSFFGKKPKRNEKRAETEYYFAVVL